MLSDELHLLYAEYHYAECHVIMLNVIMLNVVMLNVIMAECGGSTGTNTLAYLSIMAKKNGFMRLSGTSRKFLSMEPSRRQFTEVPM